MKRRRFIILPVLVFLIVLAQSSLGIIPKIGAKTYDVNVAENLFSDGEFVRGPNVEDFDIKTTIKEKDKDYEEFGQIIDNTSEQYSINPKLMLVLIDLIYDKNEIKKMDAQEFENGIEQLSIDVTDYYYAFISDTVEVGGSHNQSIVETSELGYEIQFDKDTNAATYAIVLLLSQTKDEKELGKLIDKADGTGLTAKYTDLFPDSDPLDESNKIDYEIVSGKKIPEKLSLLNYVIPKAQAQTTPFKETMQFPYKVGSSWVFNGVHSTNMSGIDFSPSSPFPGWLSAEDNTTATDYQVVAAAGGTATKSSNCLVYVDHGDGWKTKYYHLENVQFTGSKTVSSDEKIAYLANTLSEATCSGGSASGRHVHFGLIYNGAFVALDGSKFSDWEVNVDTTTTYSTDCTKMYLKKGETTKCPYSSILNDPPSSTTEPYSMDEYGVLHGERWDLLPPADVTGDGLADLIAFDTETNAVNITRSTGSSFHSSETNGSIANSGSEIWNTNTKYSPTDWDLLPPADVNGDGLADLIAYNRETTAIDVTKSNGSNFGGGYAGYEIWNSRTFYSDTDWQLLAPADVNGDSMADIIAYNPATTAVDVTLSDGTSFGGGYGNPQVWNGRTYYSASDWQLLAPADVDGDNMADIIAYNPDTTAVDVTLSDGTSFGGGYGNPQVWNTRTRYSSTDWKLLSPTDVNGDSMADIIAYNPSNTAVDVTLSDGTSFGGGDGNPQIWNSNSKYSSDDWILLAPANVNVDSEGKADLIAYSKTTHAVDVTLSTGVTFGTSKFGNSVWNSDTRYGTDWDILEPGDVNGDGKDDIIAFNPTTKAVDVTLSNGTNFGGGDGGFQVWNSNTRYGSDWKIVDPADVTGDGLVDIVAINQNTGKIDVTPSTGTNFGGGDGGFQEWLSQSSFYQSLWKILRPADIDGDGTADFIAYSQGTGEFQVAFSDGVSFGTPEHLTYTPYHLSGWKVLNPADINGDGKFDIIAANTSTYEFEYMKSDGSQLLAPWTSSIELLYDSGDVFLDPADIDGDGFADLIIHNSSTGLTKIVRSTGTNFGTIPLWKEIWNYNSTYLSSSYNVLSPSDVSGDGKADLIAFKASDRSLEVTKSTGESFGPGYSGYQVWNTNTRFD